MSGDLRRDFREDRIKRFRWRSWGDIAALVGTSLVVGFFTWWFLMEWTAG